MTRQTPKLIAACFLTVVALTTGCGDPCIDDGPARGECKNAGVGDGTGTGTGTQTGESGGTNEGTGEGGTDEGDGDGDPTGDGDGDPTGDGDGDPTGDGDGDLTGDGDGDLTGDGDGDDPCANGMQDPGETDVDCGGVCVDINPMNEDDIEGQCNEGDLCDSIEDCVAGICTDEGICNVCPDEMPPEFDPLDLGYNECQSCLLTNCCDAVLACFMDIPKCACWFNCVENTGATQACMDTCGNGNIGGINSCMNNSCKAEGNNLNCAVP